MYVRAFGLFFFWCISLVAAEGQRIVLPKNATPTHYAIWIAPDADNLTFDGSVSIDFNVNEPTKSIILNSADLKFKTVQLVGRGAPVVSFDTAQETARFEFEKPLEKGSHTLRIEYSGQIFKSAAGLFALDYVTNGQTKRGLYTQFENSDARRMFPCFDEPGIKATFALSAKVPANLMAVSNMPVTWTKKEGGFKTVRFADSPKMSTYLLFFALGDFERVTTKVNGVEIGVVVKRGDSAKAKFALQASRDLLPFYEDYFGVKYPLPKLDLIAAPGTSQIFSAMENWGAILYFDRAVLIDPKISTERDKRYVYLVVAHETAHQWFGNLVTMAWWDDLWLNEGFATWMETFATDHFHPEWKAWLALRDETSGGMRLDAKLGTHPIVQPIFDVLQASQAFDSITYQKGAAVIRMLESWVGTEKFREGLRSYMKKYAYANTVSDDLWREIDNAPSTGITKRTITDIAHGFTLQAGVPLIDVKKEEEGWELSQSVFVADNSTPKDRTWPVPVDATQPSIPSIRSEYIVKSGSPVKIGDTGSGQLFLNRQLSGYYRTRYDNASFAKLLGNFEQLPMEVQLGLIDDTRELASFGYAPVAQMLELSRKINPKLNSLVLERLLGTLEYLDNYYDDLPTQAALRSFALRHASPLLPSIGWTAEKGEDANMPALRATLLQLLGKMGDASVIGKANTYFEAFLKNKNALSPELRSIVLGIVARLGDEKRWRQLHELAQKAGSVVEQQQLYTLLTFSENQALAKKTLELALDDKTPHTIGPNLIRGVARRFPKMAFEFAIAHADWLASRLESQTRARFPIGIVSDAYDRALVADIDAYAAKSIAPSAMQVVYKTKAAINLNADIREKRLKEIDLWLKKAL